MQAHEPSYSPEQMARFDSDGPQNCIAEAVARWVSSGELLENFEGPSFRILDHDLLALNLVVDREIPI
jgi:hypothetical protein